METKEIIGKNYTGKWNGVRTACRCVVLSRGMLLLSYESAAGVYMIPGGGLEPGESEEGCCMREVAEETGYTVSLSPCLLEIDEYYGDMKYVSRYFSGTVTGRCETALTEAEKKGGLEPRWLPAPDALGIFSAHSDPGCKDEVKRGIYEREYEALRRILGTHS
ncbi:MAG: NUDIX domain-containing protein [Clostridia bacterium]|nr:NUDIX domain-containing protein [Clostridia bacterium]